MNAKRDRITLETKLKILDEIDRKISYEDIKNTYNVKSISTISGKSFITYNSLIFILSDIKRNRRRYEEAFDHGLNAKSKSIKKGKFFEVEQQTVSFVNEMNDKGAQVTMDTIRQKALTIAVNEGSNMKASYGWVQKLMRRNNIGVYFKHGDASTVSMVTIDEWKDKLTAMIEEYEEDNIFNADETGLFYSLLPSRTLAVKGKKSSQENQVRLESH